MCNHATSRIVHERNDNRNVLKAAVAKDIKHHSGALIYKETRKYMKWNQKLINEQQYVFNRKL